MARAEHLLALSKKSSGAPAGALESRAERQLALAEPIAAVAAGDDATWQALQANLQNASSLPPSLIMPALRADCASGDGG